MKRQNTSKKRGKLAQGIDTVTSTANKQQSRAGSENSVSADQISRLKSLIELVNLLPPLTNWYERNIETENFDSSLHPTLDWKNKGFPEIAVRAELNKIVQGLSPKLQQYIKLFDLDEIKKFCADLEPQEVIQEIDFTNIETVNASFNRIRAEGRLFINQWGELLRDALYEVIGKNKFIFYKGLEGSDPRYTNVLCARKRLIELLAARELFYAISSDKPKVNLMLTAHLYRQIEEYSHQAWLIIDQNNQIKICMPELFHNLENVDITKIRKCPICMKIFWADHGRMKFCSEKCGTTSRVRLWRENYQSKYKQQRIKKVDEQDVKAKLALGKKSPKKQKGK